MGLLDRLAERVFDDATASHRDSIRRRQVLRDEVISELRKYSEAIEKTRVAYLRVLDALAAPAPTDRLGSAMVELRVDSFTALFPDTEGAIDRGLEADLDYEDFRLLEDHFVRRARAMLPPVGHRAVRTLAADAEVEAGRLDDAWVRVRPVLDDALEIEAVAFLRVFRHDLRHLVSDADISVKLLLSADSSKLEEAREVATRCIEEVLVLADVWNSHVCGVRREVRHARRL